MTDNNARNPGRPTGREAAERRPSGSADPFELTRRSLVIGGVGVAGLGLPSLAEAASAVDGDRHTLDTYRAAVDAIVPRTADLGPDQEAGALDVELEKYLIWNMEHGETLDGESGRSDRRGKIGGHRRVRIDRIRSRFEDRETGVGLERAAERIRSRGSDRRSAEAGERLRDRIEARVRSSFDEWLAAGEHPYDVHLPAEANALEELVIALEHGLGFSVEDDLGMPRAAVFGSLRGLSLRVKRDGDVVLVVESAAADGSVEREVETRSTVPMATLHAAALDLYAIVLVLGGGATGPIRPRAEFPGGGFYTFLAPEDRVQCLLFTIQDADVIADVVEELLPEAALVGGLSSTAISTAPYGYYSEWAGYGDTKTEPMPDRELQRPVETVQGYAQVGYAGPADGYAGTHGFEIESFVENDWE